MFRRIAAVVVCLPLAASGGLHSARSAGGGERPAALAAVAGTSGVATETGVAIAAIGGPAAAAIDRGTDPGLDTEWIHDTLGIDGAGIGVATIDSGVNASHDDLGSGRIVHW